MSNKEIRISTYVDEEMQQWVTEKSKEMCLKESAFIRILIFNTMKQDQVQTSKQD